VLVTPIAWAMMTDDKTRIIPIRIGAMNIFFELFIKISSISMPISISLISDKYLLKIMR
jgi:hypothetical protein